jgi:hypothetical protein
MNKFLTKEIVRHIFTSFGIIERLIYDGNVLSDDSLLTNKTVKIEYKDDNNTIMHEHKIYAGQINIDKDSQFKAVFIDISQPNDSVSEYCCAFGLNKLPIYGIRLAYDDEDFGLFKIYDEKLKNWMDAPITTQAMSVVGVENIVSYGLLWEPCKDFEALYKASISLI